MEKDLVNINGMQVEKIEYGGQPVITYRMIDDLHVRPPGTAYRTFNKHKNRFEEGLHFFDIPYDEWSTMTALRKTYGGSDTGQRNAIRFFTQAGYLLLVKPFSDNLAWKVQDCLIRDYFRLRQEMLRDGQNLTGSSRFRGAQENSSGIKKLTGSKKLTFATIEREFRSACKLLQTAGSMAINAKLLANDLILERYGVDCLGMAGTRESLENQLLVESRSPSVGMEILEKVLGHSFSWRFKGETMRLTIREALECRPDHPVLKKTIENFGVRKVDGGIFLLPKRVQEKILSLSRGQLGEISGIRDYILELPGARPKQVRLNGPPRRGVLVPWEGGAA